MAGGGGLLLAKFAEGYKKFVVGVTSVVQESAHNRLDTENAGIVKARAIGGLFSVLYFGAIHDGGVFVRGLLRFLGVGVVEFDL